MPAVLRTVALIAGLLLAASVGAQSSDYQEASKLFHAGQYPQALERVDAFLKTNPKDARGRFLRGLILTEQNKNADAIKVFTGLTEDYPELPEPYNNLAVLYASQGQYDKARSALEMSIRTHPSYATAHENLGDIYAKMASQAYDKALQLDKTNTAAQTKLELIKEIFSGTTRTRPATTGKTETKPLPITVAEAKSAPAVKPAARPAPAATDPSSEVLKAVNSWARAWSDNDVSGYLGYYAPDFETPGGEPRSDWEAARKARIAKPKKIEVKVEAPKVKFTSANRVTVTFRQNYRSPGLKVASTKTLVMVKTGERWLIQQERVGG